jgi:hypothetical protein
MHCGAMARPAPPDLHRRSFRRVANMAEGHVDATVKSEGSIEPGDADAELGGWPSGRRRRS